MRIQTCGWCLRWTRERLDDEGDNIGCNMRLFSFLLVLLASASSPMSTYLHTFDPSRYQKSPSRGCASFRYRLIRLRSMRSRELSSCLTMALPLKLSVSLATAVGHNNSTGELAAHSSGHSHGLTRVPVIFSPFPYVVAALFLPQMPLPIFSHYCPCKQVPLFNTAPAQLRATRSCFLHRLVRLYPLDLLP